MSRRKRSRRGGPEDPQVKARSLFVVRHGDHAAFERLVHSPARDFLPRNDVEYNLVRQLASVKWRFQCILLMDSASHKTLRLHGAGAPQTEGYQPGFATRRLLENSRLPYSLLTRQSRLIYARSSPLFTLAEWHRGVPLPEIPAIALILLILTRKVRSKTNSKRTPPSLLSKRHKTQAIFPPIQPLPRQRLFRPKTGFVPAPSCTLQRLLHRQCRRATRPGSLLPLPGFVIYALNSPIVAD